MHDCTVLMQLKFYSQVLFPSSHPSRGSVPEGPPDVGYAYLDNCVTMPMLFIGFHLDWLPDRRLRLVTL